MRNHCFATLILSLAGLTWGTLGTNMAAALPDESGRSATTDRILRQQGLERLAKEDPTAAIQALDRLRTHGKSEVEALSTAIASLALEAGWQEASDSAVGYFLCAASQTYTAALAEASPLAEKGHPDSGPTALDLHRLAIEGLIASLQREQSPSLGSQVVEVTGPLSRYDLSWANAPEEWTSATYELVADSSLQREEKEVHLERPGIGAPMVAVRRGGIPEELEHDGSAFLLYRYSYPLTAILELGDAERLSPRPIVLRFVDPYLFDRHRLGGKDYPLAIGIGGQFAALRREADTDFSISGMVRAGKHMSRAGLYALEPLRPDKIPVILVHGLVSDPDTWIQAFEGLLLDSEIRQNFQFLIFAYPPALHFGYSATLLRRTLVRLEARLAEIGAAPVRQRMILVGHSLGGLVARLQVTRSGSTLWNAIFDEPPESLDLPQEDIELLKEILIVDPLPFVERIIFCSTPHRGSDFARNIVGRLGSAVVGLPPELENLSRRVLLGGRDDLADWPADRKKISDSIQTLRPDHPFTLALDELEIDSRVTYHSLIGDKGKGDTPESSDGIVPYWSSHLDGAASELIVPSGHGSHQHPEGIDELLRILREHLEAVAPKTNQGIDRSHGTK